MESDKSMYVTHIEVQGPILIIWGQLDRNMSTFIERLVLNWSESFSRGIGVIPNGEACTGLLCCALYSDGNYYRAEILECDISAALVKVKFIDYGNIETIQAYNIRAVPQGIAQASWVPPLAHPHILAGVFPMHGIWNSSQLTFIKERLLYENFHYEILAQYLEVNIIRVYYADGVDFREYLLQQGVSIVDLQDQLSNFRSQLSYSSANVPVAEVKDIPLPVAPQRKLVSQPQPSCEQDIPSQEFGSYCNMLTTPELEIHNRYEVKVADVGTGPDFFWITLMSDVNKLRDITKRLSKVPLKCLRLPLVPGTFCIAKFRGSDVLCRGVITHLVSETTFEIFYVDFGNSEVLPYIDIYELPRQYTEQHAMAIPFQLFGIKSITITPELVKLFKSLVVDKVLNLIVLPQKGPSVRQCGSLYYKDKGILDILKVKGVGCCQFPKGSIFLKLGVRNSVVISYLESLENFYIQDSALLGELDKLMSDIQKYCNSDEASKVHPMDLYEGFACCALYSDDNQWYRAKVLSTGQDTVSVEYVDYGNAETVSINKLCCITAPFAQKEPFAMKCCLKDNADIQEKNLSNELEEFLVETGCFSCELNKYIGDECYMVTLYDSSTNVDVKNQILQFGGQAEKPVEAENNGWVEEESAGASFINDYKTFQETSNRERGGKDVREKKREDVFRKKDDYGSKTHIFRNEQKEFDSYKGKKKDNFGKREERNSDSNYSRRKFPNDKKDFRNSSKDEGDGNRKGKSLSFISRTDQVKMETRTDFGSRDNFRKQKQSFRKFEGKRHINVNDDDDDKVWDITENENNEPQSQTQDLCNTVCNGTYTYMDLVNQEHQVIVSWFVNPNEFYCQFLKMHNNFRNMMESIQSICRHRQTFQTTPHEGTPVLAKFKDDDVVYRAAVVKSGNTPLVQFVDYGNKDIVPLNNIWPIDANCLEIPVQTMKCRLVGIKSVTGEWPRHHPNIDKLFNQGAYTCTFLNKSADDVWDIKLEVNEIDIAEELINLKLAEPAVPNSVAGIKNTMFDPDLCLGLRLFAHVTYIESVNRFYVQLDPVCADEIQGLIKDHINNQEEHDEKLDVSPGKLCLGSQWDVWYRARILEGSTCSKILVYFIDYGDSATLEPKQVRPITDSLQIIHPPLAYECCIAGWNGLTISPEIEEHFSHDVENQDVILHIDKFENHKFHVEMFDIEGQSLELLSAVFCKKIQCVEPICDVPLLCSKLEVLITHIEKPATFYLRRVADDEAADSLAAKLEEFYSVQNSGSKATITENGLCAAKSNNGLWCRSRIKHIDDSEITVFFIDTGKIETVSHEHIKHLESFFHIPHALSFECSLPIIVLDPEKIHEKFGDCVCLGSGTNQAFFARDKNKKLVFDFYYNKNMLLSNKLIEVGLAEGVNSNPLKLLLQQEFNELTVKTVEPGKRRPVYISNVNSPSDFWFQLGLNVDAIHTLQCELQAESELFETILPSVGSLCLAQYSEDMLWYRAKVIESNEDTVTVRFVDYGNSDVISTTSGCLKHLPSRYSNLPEYAVHCTLNIYPVTGATWTNECNNKFENIIAETGGVLIAEVLKTGEKTVVDLFLDENSISNLLIDENLALPFSPLIDKPVSSNQKLAYITYIDSLSCFWIQFISDTYQLQIVSDKLQTANTFNPCVDIKEDILCAALFMDDELWYRARIVNCNKSIEVNFIDYGNSSAVSDVRCLPSDLQKIPPLAKCCQITHPLNNNWLPEQENMFRELVESTYAAFPIQELQEEPYTITLFIDGKRIEDLLTSECIQGNSSLIPYKISVLKAYVTTVQSPSRFWIQLENDTSSLDLLVAQLLTSDNFDQYMDAPIGEICAALFLGDKSWYRAQILNKCNEKNEIEVLFVDYGNSAFVTDIRKLPENLSIIPPLAKCCTLNYPDDISVWSELQQELFADMVEGKEIPFEIELLNEGDPWTVSLFINGERIENILIKSSIQTDVCPAAIGQQINTPEAINETSTLGTEVLTVVEKFEQGIISEVIKEIPCIADSMINSVTSVDSTNLIRSFVSFVESPSKFWVQLEKDSHVLEELTEQLLITENLDFLEDPEEGMTCAALYLEDNSWYRAQVINKCSKNNEIEVFFVDYGNSAFVSDIRKLPENLSIIPPLAKCCTLNYPDDISIWSELQQELFVDMVEGKDIPFELELLREDDPWIVSLHINGERIENILRESLIADETAVCTSSVVGQHINATEAVNDTSASEAEALIVVKQIEQDILSEVFKEAVYTVDSNIKSLTSIDSTNMIPCFVTFVEDPTKFWVQLKKDSHLLEELAEQLLNPENLEFFPDPAEGTTCAALYREDNSWYRAQVLNKYSEKNEIEVLFVDYGNSAFVREIRKLPEDLSVISPVAKCCTLHCTDVHTWTESQKKLFSGIVEGKDISFALEVLRQGDPWTVSLFINGKSIESVIRESSEAPAADICTSSVVGQQNNIGESAVSETRLISIEQFEQKMISASIEGQCTDENTVKSGSSVETGAKGLLVRTPGPTEVNDISSVDSQLTVNEIHNILNKCVSKDLLNEENLTDSISADLNTFSGRVTAIESPSCFWVQPDSEVKKLAEIAEKLLDGNKFEPCSSISDRTIYAALSPGDNLYYRACVKSVVLEDKMEVFLIDYGISIFVTEIRKLPQNLTLLPPIAVCCKLHNPKSCDGWTIEQDCLFKEFIKENGSFVLKVIEPGNPLLVSLMVDDQKMEDILSLESSRIDVNNKEGFYLLDIQHKPVKSQSENNTEEVEFSENSAACCHISSVDSIDMVGDEANSPVSEINAVIESSLASCFEKIENNISMQAKTNHYEERVKTSNVTSTVPNTQSEHTSTVENHEGLETVAITVTNNKTD